MYYLSRLLRSLKEQNHSQWKLFLVGDCYTDSEEELLNLVKETIGIEKLTWVNMSEPGERGRLTGRALWCSGGVKAKNRAIMLARDEGYEWAACLDDDDFWSPGHLQCCSKAIAKFPNAVSVFTRAHHDSKNHTIVYPKSFASHYHTVQWPQACNVIHSSVCYRTDRRLAFEYREVPYPADADLWRRMPALAAASGLTNCHGVLVDELTVYYNGKVPTIMKNLCPFLILDVEAEQCAVETSQVSARAQSCTETITLSSVMDEIPDKTIWKIVVRVTAKTLISTDMLVDNVNKLFCKLHPHPNSCILIDCAHDVTCTARLELEHVLKRVFRVVKRDEDLTLFRPAK
jgi:hypothetical protein